MCCWTTCAPETGASWILRIYRRWDLSKVASICLVPEVCVFVHLGNGHKLLRHCEHAAGAGHDEVLEGEAHNPEKAGKNWRKASQVWLRCERLLGYLEGRAGRLQGACNATRCRAQDWPHLSALDSVHCSGDKWLLFLAANEPPIIVPLTESSSQRPLLLQHCRLVSDVEQPWSQSDHPSCLLFELECE